MDLILLNIENLRNLNKPFWKKFETTEILLFENILQLNRIIFKELFNNSKYFDFMNSF
jgi:hypothetical protein